jgi:hypothetical protein
MLYDIIYTLSYRGGRNGFTTPCKYDLKTSDVVPISTLIAETVLLTRILWHISEMSGRGSDGAPLDFATFLCIETTKFSSESTATYLEIWRIAHFLRG